TRMRTAAQMVPERVRTPMPRATGPERTPTAPDRLPGRRTARRMPRQLVRPRAPEATAAQVQAAPADPARAAVLRTAARVQAAPAQEAPGRTAVNCRGPALTALCRCSAAEQVSSPPAVRWRRPLICVGR